MECDVSVQLLARLSHPGPVCLCDLKRFSSHFKSSSSYLTLSSCPANLCLIFWEIEVRGWFFKVWQRLLYIEYCSFAFNQVQSDWFELEDVRNSWLYCFTNPWGFVKMFHRETSAETIKMKYDLKFPGRWRAGSTSWAVITLWTCLYASTSF